LRRFPHTRGIWLAACAFAVIAVIIAGWLLQKPPVIGPPLAAPERADYYLRDAVVDVMDENGNLSYRMKTTELLRYNDRSSRLTDVEIEYLGGEDGVWRLAAGEARLTDGQQNLRLSGGVRMSSQGARGAMLLTTESLDVDLENKRMSTSNPVQIEHPEYQAQAVGMQAAFKEKTLTLMNNVRTRYVP
jgi:LPS export ABC transporter protein LptC